MPRERRIRAHAPKMIAVATAGADRMSVGLSVNTGWAARSAEGEVCGGGVLVCPFRRRGGWAAADRGAAPGAAAGLSVGVDLWCLPCAGAPEAPVGPRGTARVRRVLMRLRAMTCGLKPPSIMPHTLTHGGGGCQARYGSEARRRTPPMGYVRVRALSGVRGTARPACRYLSVTLNARISDRLTKEYGPQENRNHLFSSIGITSARVVRIRTSAHN